MNPRFRILPVFLALCMWVFVLASQSHAAKPIAQVSSFTGEVIIQSGTDIFRLTQLGLTLNDGDRIQIKHGEVQIIFNDGAVMKMRPFTNTTIQEREEKSGFWIFKTKKAVRRITCFVGKLWFKAGVSKRRNYLQTPTAVCGVRGSDFDWGFDPGKLETYLNIYAGEAEVVGKVIRGFFEDPGIDAATRSRVYQSLAAAYEITEQARATERAVDLAEARVEALKVVREAAAELRQNPDDNIAGEAQVAANVADANIAAAEAQVALEQLIEAGASDAEIQSAQTAADSAQTQADAANEAAKEIYVEGVLDPGSLDEAIEDTATAATAAQTAAQEATDIRDEVVPTTTTTTTTTSTTSTTTTTTTATTTTTTPTTTTTTSTTTTTPTTTTTTTTMEMSPSQ
jgi:hypothetical protein